MTENISRDEVRGTWRRCLIQFHALDYAIWHEEIGGAPSSVEKPEVRTNPDKENRSLYVFLQDMFPCLLLYPGALCKLRRRTVDLSERIETSRGVRPLPEEENLFSEMILGFGSADDKTGVSEEEEFLRLLFNPMSWENPETVVKNIKTVIAQAGLTRLIEALRNMPGLVRRDKSLDVSIRYRILCDWMKLTDPKVWGVRIEAISALDSQLPIVERAFSTAKSTPVQQEYRPEALRVMMGFLRPAVEIRRRDLGYLLKTPTFLGLRNAFSIICNPETEGDTKLRERYRDLLGSSETYWWVMSDAVLATLFDKVRSRLDEDHILRKEEVIPSSLFQGSLPRGIEMIGAGLIGQSLLEFKQRRDNLAPQLGIQGIRKIAGGLGI